MALTDYGNMFGCLEFYFEAQKKGIKSILGTESYYVEDRRQTSNPRDGENFRDPMKGFKTIVLLAKNLEAYKNICCISTESYQTGFYFVPRADYNLLNKYKKDVIALTGGGRSRVAQIFFNKGVDQARQEIKKLHTIFNSNLYLEFLHSQDSLCEKYNIFLLEMSKDLGIPCLATGDVHYVEKDESLIQDILFCIGTNQILNDKTRSRLASSEFYFKSSKEMQDFFQNHKELHSHYKKSCDISLDIADQCSVHFKIKDKKGHPIYHLPKARKNIENLGQIAKKNLAIRFQQAEKKQEPIGPQKQKEYLKRINYELDIIERMGFNGYFYIVYDFISWAKKNNIPVGPGRGSGASSLVSYCLGITDLDPMPLNLIFERFLNPERISMPDFDIDFCQENRPKVLNYITEKYGSACSSHVITYGKLSVRSAMRDVGRVLALSYNEVNHIVKFIPDILGITLKEAIKKEPRLKRASDEDPKIAELLKLTQLLEGLIRHVGIHAAGIIISDNPIINYAPLYKGSDGENVIQYDLTYAEKIGLVKFDFLGLKTLTHLAETCQLIKKNHNKDVCVQDISLKDKGIYEIMSSGDTIGVFQFEGAGITDLLVKSQVRCFEDIIAINALYRPGPMNMIPSYLDRKKNRVPVTYLLPELEPILKDTYGIIIYQEQVQQIAVKIAGYSYGEADVLRRAMGKKIRSVMEKQKDRFLSGAKKQNYNLKKASSLFDLMAEFAKYGFNKSHAAAYCVLAAQTAWFKKYYPVEFLASQMSIDKDDSDKLLIYICDAKKHGISVISPHVNNSYYKFHVDGKKIFFSLSAIKNIGEASVKDIVQARDRLKSKSFQNLEEFFENIDLKKTNRKTLEALIKSGSLDNLGYSRSDIFNNLEHFHHYATKKTEDKISGQASLFSENLKKENRVHIIKQTRWSDAQSIVYEKDIFGFYLNKHPMTCIKGFEQALSCKTLLQLQACKTNTKSVSTLATLSNIKEIITKKKSQLMAFSLIEDGDTSLEAVFFPEVYKDLQDLQAKKELVFYITGQLQNNNKSQNCQIIIEKVRSLAGFLRNIQVIKLDLHPYMISSRLNMLKSLLSKCKKGVTQVQLRVYIPEKKCFVNMDTRSSLYNIEVNQDFLQNLKSLFIVSKNLELSQQIYFSNSQTMSVQ